MVAFFFKGQRTGVGAGGCARTHRHEIKERSGWSLNPLRGFKKAAAQNIATSGECTHLNQILAGFAANEYDWLTL